MQPGKVAAVMNVEKLAVHPLQSVTVTAIGPIPKENTSSEVAPLLQAKVYWLEHGDPPLTVISTAPLLLVGVEVGTTNAVIKTGEGSTITTEAEAEHPLIASVETQV